MRALPRTPGRVRPPEDTLAGVAVVAGLAVVVAVVLFGAREEPGTDAPLSPAPDVRVVDGDTLAIHGRRVRLHGIDAPEKGQHCSGRGHLYDCGAAAARHLARLVAGAGMDCRKVARDRWGREVARCTAGGRDIGGLMVRHGWALAYRRYSSDYVDDEAFARSNRLGMWSGSFTAPSEWRRSEGGQRP